jgi:hypothetical protein
VQIVSDAFDHAHGGRRTPLGFFRTRHGDQFAPFTARDCLAEADVVVPDLAELLPA